MSLWHIQTIAPCMEYSDFGSCFEPPGPPTPPYYYGKNLITCPKHYQQSTMSVSHFFYDPAEDVIKVLVVYSTTYWPSWDVQLLKFSPETGEWLNRTEVLAKQSSAGIWGFAWTSAATMGSFNKIYATMNPTTAILEVDSNYLTEVDGGWSVNPNADPWDPHSLYRFAVVNRVDQILAGGGSWTIDHWRNINSTPELFATTRLPSTISYMCYESRNYLWIISPDGTISKLDYKVPRYEMLSSVQNPELTAVGFKITFDTKRKRVVVFRQMPDAEDGACQHQLEFYYPMVNATALTAPVPITSLRAGGRVTFVSHLHGSAGEGVTPFTAEAELLSTPHGYLTSPFAGTELNGRITHGYVAPNESAEDTIQVTVDIEEQG
jgi:hypothetical protein